MTWTSNILRHGANCTTYYAALCGFLNLVEHLIVNNSEHVDAVGGYYVAPLIAVLEAGQSQTAKPLRDNGAHKENSTAFCSLAWGLRDGSGITRVQSICQRRD